MLDALWSEANTALPLVGQGGLGQKTEQRSADIRL